jgi:type IV secretory pathway VirB10-like protein
MQKAVANWLVAMGVGLALIAAQGCKKRAAPAPVQPVVLGAPRVHLDFPIGPMPVEDDVDSGAMPRMERAAPRKEVQPVQVQRPDEEAAAVAEAKRQQDATLLQQQEAASQRQQQELDQEIEQYSKRQEEMEAEPRIQDIPEVPLQPAPVESTEPQ